jgi:hypothetical protein
MRFIHNWLLRTWAVCLFVCLFFFFFFGSFFRYCCSSRLLSPICWWKAQSALTYILTYLSTYLPTLNKIILAPSLLHVGCIAYYKNIFKCSGIFYWRFSIFNFHYYCFQKQNISCLVAWNTINILTRKVGSLNWPSNFLSFSITVKSQTNQPY